MIIAIPSKGRAGETTSEKILHDKCVYYVPESEAHQYSQFIKNVIPVPNTVIGITATRNWILKNTNDKKIVFVDDDVRSCGYILINKNNAKKIEITDPLFWYDEFLKIFDVCEQLDYKIWGLKTEDQLKSCYPYKPILFQSYVTASCMGIVNDGTYYFDEEFKVKEDYELCLRHIKERGGLIAIRYLHWENEHWETDGGCKDYRTIDVERNAIKKLVKMYPGMIREAKRKANEFTIQLNF